ncbi:MAG: hypothetical protein WD749_07540 [Phycisphaerales bacterium]
MTREVERFKARSDDGRYETVVILYRRMISAATRDDPRAVMPGPRQARTLDGFACNYLDENLYEVLDHPKYPGLMVRRVKDGPAQ